MMSYEKKVEPDGSVIAVGTENAVKISEETLEEYGFVFQERNGSKTNNTIVVDKEYIKDGDLFTTYVIDGTHTLFMLFTGSRTGHNAVALWEDGELYVVEAVVRKKKKIFNSC